MSQSELPAWAYRYLERLGLTPEPPSYSFLGAICRAHLVTVPFENISKLLYYQSRKQMAAPIPPVELFVDNMSRYHFGGTCYTLNSRLYLLLKALGFDCYYVLLGSDHMSVLVRLPDLPGERVFVDCGSAAPLFSPVRFERDQQKFSSFAGEQIRLVPDQKQQGWYRYLRYRRNELISNEWLFHPDDAKTFGQFIPIIERSNQPGTPFMTLLRCQLFQLDKRRNLSLRNNVFTIRYEDGSDSKLLLGSAEEIRQVLADEFRLPRLPVEEAVKVLQSLGVDVFAPMTQGESR
ncbi:arylamine N-acetyltransferase [Brevibacillus humidisoli]|uniref:arylamine N-acetyltransferase n=1 Tax=Brevibacillus humidisoli TaxID=2895522 RepID=UPI001E4D7368|nr:arylamine N-acetyltransferase [Brevibacillus humidisoli]UFJ41853.1 arylamine N-acetyltransferase [Brevibacillus humidisoli]